MTNGPGPTGTQMLRAIGVVIGLAVLLAFVIGRGCRADAAVFNHHPAQHRVETMLEDGRLIELVDEALGSMLRVATREMRQRGYELEADQIDLEWAQERLLLTAEDLGEHWPLSERIAEWYRTIEAALGVELCETLHLRDIFVLNYGMTVVMAPHQDEEWCAEQLANWPDDRCEFEYSRHFSGTKWVLDAGSDEFATTALHHGVASVVSWWITFAACEAALYGTDATFACSPVATAVEFGVERWVAPRVAKEIWEQKNGAAQ